jgi:arylsulfatase A-like enzyme
VRFVQVYSDGEWDAHADLAGNHSGHCAATDAPIDALLTDLKRRGLLDSTLVIWGGEFGRMPVSQGNGGRDHNPHGFLIWMAGAGIKGGASHGETDEFGHKAVTDRVSVHDLHATMLHLLGIDHKKLTYFYNGRQYRLTDVAGDVLKSILA